MTGRTRTIPSLFTLGCVLIIALPLKAQNQKKHQKWEAFGGYQFTSFQVLHGFAANPPKVKGNGWDLSLDYRIKGWLGAKADFSYSRGSGGTQLGVSNGPTNLLMYTFGPTVSAHITPNAKPFAEFLIGRYDEQVQYFSTTPFHGVALMAGGGTDAEATKHLAARLFEVDWLGFMNGYQFGEQYGAKSNFRISAGIVFHW